MNRLCFLCFICLLPINKHHQPRPGEKLPYINQTGSYGTAAWLRNPPPCNSNSWLLHLSLHASLLLKSEFQNYALYYVAMFSSYEHTPACANVYKGYKYLPKYAVQQLESEMTTLCSNYSPNSIFFFWIVTN